MSADTFDFGFHRAILRSLRATPEGGNMPCIRCGGPTLGGTVTYKEQPEGEITGSISCQKKRCFAIIQHRIRPSEKAAI